MVHILAVPTVSMSLLQDHLLVLLLHSPSSRACIWSARGELEREMEKVAVHDITSRG